MARVLLVSYSQFLCRTLSLLYINPQGLCISTSLMMMIIQFQSFGSSVDQSELTVFPLALCCVLFLGFYYVCVDFNPQHTGSLGSQASQHLPQPNMPTCPEDIIPSSSANSSSLVKPELSPRARRESVNRGAQRLGRSSSSSRSAPSSNVATMSGFYFHQNSEP